MWHNIDPHFAKDRGTTVVSQPTFDRRRMYDKDDVNFQLDYHAGLGQPVIVIYRPRIDVPKHPKLGWLLSWAYHWEKAKKHASKSALALRAIDLAS